MTVWVIPYIIVAAIVSWITISSVRKSSKITALTTGRSEIPTAVEEHPFTLNPIIWIILVTTMFIGVVIAYYAFNLG